MYRFPDSLSMEFLDIAFHTPEHNLACDEALLDLCEQRPSERSILRFWESERYFIVIGYSNRVRTEVSLEACRSLAVPVLRRYSGGGAVLQGPGCLNYSLILPTRPSGPLSSITGTSSLVLRRHCDALQPLLDAPIEPRGQSDLALGERKCSGNAQRRRQHFLLFHGTFLLDLDLAMAERCLPLPTIQPEYRQNRSHTSFMKNLHLPPALVKEALRDAWGAEKRDVSIPYEAMDRLVGERYALRQWTFRL